MPFSFYSPWSTGASLLSHTPPHRARGWKPSIPSYELLTLPPRNDSLACLECSLLSVRSVAFIVHSKTQRKSKLLKKNNNKTSQSSVVVKFCDCKNKEKIKKEKKLNHEERTSDHRGALTSVKGNVGVGCEKQDQTRRASNCDASPSQLQAEPQEHGHKDCPRQELYVGHGCLHCHRPTLPARLHLLRVLHYSQTAVNCGPPFQTQGPMGTHFAFKPRQHLKKL